MDRRVGVVSTHPHEDISYYMEVGSNEKSNLEDWFWEGVIKGGTCWRPIGHHFRRNNLPNLGSAGYDDPCTNDAGSSAHYIGGSANHRATSPDDDSTDVRLHQRLSLRLSRWIASIRT